MLLLHCHQYLWQGCLCHGQSIVDVNCITNAKTNFKMKNYNMKFSSCDLAKAWQEFLSQAQHFLPPHLLVASLKAPPKCKLNFDTFVNRNSYFICINPPNK